MIPAAPDQSEDYVFQFILLSGFSMLSLVAAQEVLQNLNLVLGVAKARWTTYSLDGSPVMSSLNQAYAVDSSVNDIARADSLMVVSGGDPDRVEIKHFGLCFSRRARTAQRIAGLCTGAYVLAQARILTSEEATVHWYYRDTLREGNVAQISCLGSLKLYHCLLDSCHVYK